MGRNKTLVTLAKCLIGSTMLFQPSGYKNAGMLGGVAISVGCGFLSLYVMLLLLEVKEMMVKQGRVPASTDFATLGVSVFGPVCGVVIKICLSLANFVCGAIYVNFVSQNVHKALRTWPSGSVHVPTNDLSLYQGLVLIPLMWLRRLKYFALTNLLGTVMTWLVIAYLYFFLVQHLVVHGPLVSNRRICAPGCMPRDRNVWCM
jgi:proton-coupled amino acid transporter